MYLARNGYLIPYGKRSGKNDYACDVRIIRQTFIVGTDTCYGASQTDELWSIEKKPDVLMCNNRSFNSYSGKLEEFFPDGMIDLVDEMIMNGCARVIICSYMPGMQSVFAQNLSMKLTKQCNSGSAIIMAR